MVALTGKGQLAKEIVVVAMLVDALVVLAGVHLLQASRQKSLVVMFVLVTAFSDHYICCLSKQI